MANMTNKPDALSHLMCEIVNFAINYPALYSIPAIREQCQRAEQAVGRMMGCHELIRVDRPFAEGFFLLELDDLMHHPSPN